MRLVDTMTDINLQFNVNVLGFQVDFLLTHRNGRQLLLETDGVAYHKRFGGSQDLPHDAYKNAIFNTAYKQSPLVRISSDELADPEKIKQKIYAKLDDAVTENCSDW